VARVGAGMKLSVRMDHSAGSKLTETGEISLVCLSPVRKTPIVVALIVSECCINIVEPPLGKLA
jgi:hypothetical protein